MQGSAEAVKEAVMGLADEVVGVRLVSQEVGPVTTTDIDTAAAVGAAILAFNVKYANAAVEGIAKLKGVPVVQQNIIYRLLDQVAAHQLVLSPHSHMRLACACVAMHVTLATTLQCTYCAPYLPTKERRALRPEWHLTRLPTVLTA